jgi:hypothetical protein
MKYPLLASVELGVWDEEWGSEARLVSLDVRQAVVDLCCLT